MENERIREIDDKLIDEVEKALNIKIYPWQRAYIKRQPYEKLYRDTEKAGSETLAYILRFLLERNGKIDRYKLTFLAEHSPKGEQIDIIWFINWTEEINAQLRTAGVYDCKLIRIIDGLIEKMKVKNGHGDTLLIMQAKTLLGPEERSYLEKRYEKETGCKVFICPPQMTVKAAILDINGSVVRG